MLLEKRDNNHIPHFGLGGGGATNLNNDQRHLREFSLGVDKNISFTFALEQKESKELLDSINSGVR